MSPQIGDDVIVTWHDPDNGNVPTQTFGVLGVELSEVGSVTALMVEGDGSATRIPRGSIFAVELDR